jgi:hypothetical protein
MNDPGTRAKSSPARANNNHGAMAQLVAHLLCKQGVRGSSPLGSTYFPLSDLLSRLVGHLDSARSRTRQSPLLATRGEVISHFMMSPDGFLAGPSSADSSSIVECCQFRRCRPRDACVIPSSAHGHVG